MRQVFIDTETTGLHFADGDRIIEIGAIELLDRERTGRELHHYLQPDRAIEEGAFKVHGISNDQLEGCPRFVDVVDEVMDFLKDAQIVAHNAPFDIDFLDAELRRLDKYPQSSIKDVCSVLDTLVLARRKHPGVSNSLDSLCERYGIDISHRELHGALKDANLLADLYLAMTGGQMGLFGGETARKRRDHVSGQDTQAVKNTLGERPPLRVLYASESEREAHDAFLNQLDGESSAGSIWRQLTTAQLTNSQ